LGHKGEARDTIPKTLLYNNSTYFKNKYDEMDGSELNEEISLIDVKPAIFDLVIQCFICKNFTLEHDANISKAGEIGIILEIVELSLELGFPDPGDAAIAHLKSILISSRSALTSNHVRRAYRLPDSHPIQKLFAKAAIQAYMRRDRHYDMAGVDRDEDVNFPDNDLDEARARSIFGLGMHFRYIRERRTIKGFKMDLAEAMDEVTSNADKRLVSRSRRHQELETVYKDPLTGEQWSP
jgi:hypothetical protein